MGYTSFLSDSILDDDDALLEDIPLPIEGWDESLLCLEKLDEEKAKWGLLCLYFNLVNPELHCNGCGGTMVCYGDLLSSQIYCNECFWLSNRKNLKHQLGVTDQEIDEGDFYEVCFHVSQIKGSEKLKISDRLPMEYRIVVWVDRKAAFGVVFSEAEEALKTRFVEDIRVSMVITTEDLTVRTWFSKVDFETQPPPLSPSSVSSSSSSLLVE